MGCRPKSAVSLLRIITSSPESLHSSSWHRFYSSPKSHFQRVGFIGLGNMGSRMANNLIKSGYTIVVYDVNDDAMKRFSEKGVLTMASPREVAEESNAVITMLPSPSHVMDVYTGQNGLLTTCRSSNRPRLFIDSSTVDPQTSRKLSAAVSGLKGCEMVDAPVSGGVVSAEAASLTFMVGGPEGAFDAARALLMSMGKDVVYCGGPGNGSTAKICNNLAMAVSMLGVSEAFALGQSLGIPAGTLTKIFNSSSARCWSSDTYNPVPGVMNGVPSSRNYEGGFASRLMVKDLRLAADAAAEVGATIPLTSLADKIFTSLCDEGHATKDFSAVFRHYFNGDDEVW
ncbi:hypothetical protein M569_04714 [Genlisea aurea]|uniref:3-hydroxyisobutyrate dehydrogenase n=1 Tax=Genlisea aurea TaxID=192259 RepID=S8E2Y2_9LAMI|nr:hypothetical protein M569_04714 [Genlisea aurea]